MVPPAFAPEDEPDAELSLLPPPHAAKRKAATRATAIALTRFADTITSWLVAL